MSVRAAEEATPVIATSSAVEAESEDRDPDANECPFGFLRQAKKKEWKERHRKRKGLAKNQISCPRKLQLPEERD